MIESLLHGALVVLVLVAAWIDLRSRRIPNLLTVLGLLLALALRAAMGWEALFSGVMAMGIVVLFALPIFALGGLGGGDVKLLGMVGGFLGLDLLWGAVFMTLVVGGALALISVLRRGKAGETLANLYIIVRGLRQKESYTGWKGAEGSAPLTIRSAGVVTRPFAVAIAAGAVYAVYPSFF